MTAGPYPQTATYTLEMPETGRGEAGKAPAVPGAAFPRALLVENVRWFCHLRWIIIASFTVFGLLGIFPGIHSLMGLHPQVAWPLTVALVLAAANIAFFLHARFLVSRTDGPAAEANLWVQIIFDLVVLTFVIYRVGSLETFVPFAYLFHIVLACIFFSRVKSLMVTGAAALLYLTSVSLEQAGLVSPAGIHANIMLRDLMRNMPEVYLFNIGVAVLAWVIVWHLTSHLSGMVLERDNALARTNRRLVESREEKARHMLRTTHELKAPFAAIDANVQLLLEGHCGVLSHDAFDVLRRISTRARRLAAEIQEMLQLANLQDPTEQMLAWEKLDLGAVVDWCLGQVQWVAGKRSVVIEQEVHSVFAIGVEDHLRMLIGNVLSNAVFYSRCGGRVSVSCRSAAGGAGEVVIEDEGIGIPAEKLPHIFDEYYRTDEAVRHNRQSTGLGLAIVRHVAQTHGIGVRVESRPGLGTRFILRFRSPEESRMPESP